MKRLERECCTVSAWNKNRNLSNPKKKTAIRLRRIAVHVGLRGFEPRQTEPKSVVLPLYYRPVPFLELGSAKIRLCRKSSKLMCPESQIRAMYPESLMYPNLWFGDQNSVEMKFNCRYSPKSVLLATLNSFEALHKAVLPRRDTQIESGFYFWFV